jgi:5-methylcytosine-specific restriction endonuclease McrA
MPKRKKATSYLDARSDPDLPADRRTALQLMWRVELARLSDDEAAPLYDEPTVERERLAGAPICPNCDGETPGAYVWCSDFCQQLTVTIRYVRRVLRDGRIELPDVQAAIGTRFLMLTGGGYPTGERALTEVQRHAILSRDKWTCQRCGASADQVDHINGYSSDPSNLQALCGACNRAKAFETTKPATGDERDEILELVNDMTERIAASRPILLCDDPDLWAPIGRSLQGARRKLNNARIRAANAR